LIPFRRSRRIAAKLGMKERETRLRLGIIGCTILAALFVDVQGVNTDYDHQYNFSRLRTFTVNFGLVWNNPQQQQRAKEDVIRELTAKGWSQVRSDTSPDGIVMIHGAVRRQESLDAWYRDGGWSWGPGMSSFSANTVGAGGLLVDVFDAKTKKLVFRGRTSGDISNDAKENVQQIDLAVQKIFQDFPPKPK
jgi:hypothetical protein